MKLTKKCDYKFYKISLHTKHHILAENIIEFLNYTKDYKLEVHDVLFCFNCALNMIFLCLKNRKVEESFENGIKIEEVYLRVSHYEIFLFKAYEINYLKSFYGFNQKYYCKNLTTSKPDDINVTNNTDLNRDDFFYLENFNKLSQRLIEFIEIELKNQKNMYKISRRTLHYSNRFDYVTQEVVPAEKPLNGILLELIKLVRTTLAEYGYLINGSIDQVTINEYRPGQGIGFHIDAHRGFGDFIIIVSLNSDICFELRKSAFEFCYFKKYIHVRKDSLLFLKGDLRYEYEHGIVPRKIDVVDDEVINRGTRYSITLRKARKSENMFECCCKDKKKCDLIDTNLQKNNLPNKLNF